MLKKTILISFFLLTLSCGYEAIHSKKNSIDYNFSVSSINFQGDRDINLKIKQKFNNYILTKKDKKFILDVRSVSEKIVTAKDPAGDPTDFENITTTKVEVYIGVDLKRKIKIKKSFKYSNSTNKFDLKNYERQLKTNLAETISDELIFKLSNIR